MIRKEIIIVVLLFFSINFFAQGGLLKDYSHVVVPTKFIIQDKENEFQLNALVRHLFKEEGFPVFMETELIPAEYRLDSCSGLRVGLDKRFTIIQTFITVTLYDCTNQVVYSAEGSSREKDFKKGYQEATRDAFRQIEDVNFSLVDITSRSTTTETKTLSKDEKIEMRKQVVRDQSDVYNLEGKTFYFFPVDGEVHVYASNAYDISAKLTPINEKMFIYNSEELDGVISKQENGDFELEYREATSKETKFLYYTLVRKAD